MLLVQHFLEQHRIQYYIQNLNHILLDHLVELQGQNILHNQQQFELKSKYRMVTTEVDLIEKVGGGSCRCMLVEDWSSEEVVVVSRNNDVVKKAEFKISHTHDDFFDSDEETNFDDISLEGDLPFNDYWDK